jgi:proliferating cell nuclear antigen
MSRAVDADDRTDDLAADDDEDPAVSILTNGDPIRSLAELLDPIADEFRVRFDEDGLHTRAVDPANVALVNLTAHAQGFERFDVHDSMTFGLSLSAFENAVTWARKRGGDGDPVAIDVFDDPARMRVRVTRPDQGITRVTEWFGIDPDMLREDPHVPTDLTLPCRADPGVKAFNQGIKAVDSNHNHAFVTRDAETFVLGSQAGGDTTPSDDEDGRTDPEDAVMFANCAWAETDDVEPFSTVFSLDYLTDIAAAIKRGKADRLLVKWGDEFPAKFEIEHDDWGFEATYMLAPRIQKDDKEGSA